MSKLNTIFEALQSKIDNGEITLETANQVLDKAKAKYTDESVGELREAAPMTLEDALNGINALLNEAEELHKEQGTATTSCDGPTLPEKTSTGEGVTAAINANDKASEKKMETLAKDNEENAKKDAQGEDGKDTTVNADDVTESVNLMKLRVYEAADKDIITKEQKDLFLDYLNLDNYTEKKDDDEEECDHEDKDGDGECDKCGADMDEDDDKKDKKKDKKDDDDDEEDDKDEKKEDDVEESTDDFTNKILNAYTEGVITEDQVINLLSK